MKISFLILTWNRYRFLEKCLKALSESIERPGESEIVVMDNGSTDETRAVLQRYASSGMVRAIFRHKNYGLNSYKKLFDEAKGEYLVTVDDDVLAFPDKIDTCFQTYMEAYPDYGYLAMNVVQNEFTNGAKPEPELYTDDVRSGLTVQDGPAGGWCSCFRSRDYRKIRFRMKLFRLSMKRCEDACLIWNFRKKLHLKAGVIKDATCFHATGPYYARQYGHLDREIAKYAQSGLETFVTAYQKVRDESDPLSADEAKANQP